MADPDYLLGELRRNALLARRSAPGSPSEVTALREAVHFANQVDGWLSSGGNAPSSWGPQDPIVTGRMYERRGFLPEGTEHDIRYVGMADGSIRAICLPCAVPGRPWTTAIAQGHDTAAFLRCWREHAGKDLPAPGDSTERASSAPATVEPRPGRLTQHGAP